MDSRRFRALNPRDQEILDVTESINDSLLANSSGVEITAAHRRPEVASRLAKLASEVFVGFTQLDEMGVRHVGLLYVR
jgi:hypothetical protein